MKVAIVSPEFPPEIGGIQTYALEFTRELARRGHDVTVFTTPAEREWSCPDFRIERVLTLRRRTDRKILVQHATDVWHVMNAACAWLALDVVAPVFVTVHGNDFLAPYFPVARLDFAKWLRIGSRLDFQLGEWLTRRLVRRALPRAAHIFANSRYTERVFLEKHPHCRGRTSAAMVGISEDYLATRRGPRADGPPRLITVARLAEPHKNVHLVLEALARLRDEFAFQYTIVGDGWLAPSLRQLTSDLGLDDCVHFTGFVDRPQLLGLLGQSDLFILTTSATPRAYEGFGLVYLEAAACGVPALAARIGGAVEAIEEGGSGMFVEACTPESIAASLARFLRGETRLEPEACRAFARKFSWAAVVDHCLARYDLHRPRQTAPG